MNECSYELYVEAFRAVREALRETDAEALRAVRREITRRHGTANLVCVLAMIEAQRGAAERSKEDVCGGVLCTHRCPAGCPSRPRS